MSDEMFYDMKSFKFGKGQHSSREEGMCLMEAVAYIAGEPHSDHPKCASTIITEIAINLNDNAKSNEERDRVLSPILWRIPGTKNALLEEKREELYNAFLNKLIKDCYLITEDEYRHIFIKGGDYKNCFDYLYYDLTIGKQYWFLKENWDSILQPLFLDLINKLIDMTEIKESVSDIRKIELQNA